MNNFQSVLALDLLATIMVYLLQIKDKDRKMDWSVALSHVFVSLQAAIISGWLIYLLWIGETG